VLARLIALQKQELGALQIDIVLDGDLQLVGPDMADGPRVGRLATISWLCALFGDAGEGGGVAYALDIPSPSFAVITHGGRCSRRRGRGAGHAASSPSPRRYDHTRYTHRNPAHPESTKKSGVQQYGLARSCSACEHGRDLGSNGADVSVSPSHVLPRRPPTF